MIKIAIRDFQQYLKIIFLCSFMFISIECLAEKTICFKIDMRKTVECGLFEPRENDVVIIRGSFNNWSGNDYSLKDKNKDNIYNGTFLIDSDSDTAHEYKYLIVKANGQELWEKCPNKDNMPNGNRFFDSSKDTIDVFDFDQYYLGRIGKDVIFSTEQLKNDFAQFRETLEKEHCCLYEYTSKKEFDKLFDSLYQLLTKPISPIEFFKMLTPITAKIGCGHTAVWMPEGFWENGNKNLFPLKIHLIGEIVVIEGSYEESSLVERGTILHEINGIPITDIIAEMRANYSADAMNIHFINSQIERRFSLIYARRFGFKEKFQIKYSPPNTKKSVCAELSAASQSSVRSVVFHNFHHPPLEMEIINTQTVLLTIPTFIYYDKVSYFTHFIDSCFALIKEKDIQNLILDLRGNDGGDPFCAAPLFSYLQKEPEPYFEKPYGKYAELAQPLPLPENHFTGDLYTLIDGRCFSTNGHFSALLKYHHIGKLIGSETGATYICNAGRNTEIQLDNTKILLYFGRSSFSAAVKGMDKTKPIIPDYPVKENYQDFLHKKDAFMEKALELINQGN